MSPQETAQREAQPRPNPEIPGHSRELEAGLCPATVFLSISIWQFPETSQKLSQSTEAVDGERNLGCRKPAVPSVLSYEAHLPAASGHAEAVGTAPCPEGFVWSWKATSQWDSIMQHS